MQKQKMGDRSVLLVAVCLMAQPAFATSSCDFDKPVSGCTARIEFQKTRGSGKSYSAEIEVHSSSPRCSKVDYLVDSTPYSTTLGNSASEHETLFASRPIQRQDIRVEKCTSYASTDKRSRKPEADVPGAISNRDFAGHWTGSLRWLLVASPMALDIQVNGNHATGSSLDEKLNYRVPIDGTISGNTLMFKFNQRDQGTATGKLVLDSATSATFSTSGSGITFSGKVHK